MHEEMITNSDSPNTVDLGSLYAILPSTGVVSREEYCATFGGSAPVPLEFAYNSGTNPEFLSVDQIRALVREHVDPSFVA
jgi:hypothetical protein